MVEQITHNLYRIGVPLEGNPLRELNSYFLRGAERDLLIDTGFRTESCRLALEEGLREVDSDPNRRDVAATHLHTDHCGMMDLFAAPTGNIYMPAPDLSFHLDSLDGSFRPIRHRRYMSEGFPEDLLLIIFPKNPAEQYGMQKQDTRFVPLADGDEIRVGDFCLKTIYVPGHTPGNAMFWEERHGIMFTGDHILFDISPNITCWERAKDSLGDYLQSLRSALDYPVQLALPGHRKSGPYHQRIRELLSHHDVRLAEILSILRSQPGLTAYEIAGKMTWKIRSRDWESFPPVQKWFAVGECLSHLDHLVFRGDIRRYEDGALRRYTLT